MAEETAPDHNGENVEPVNVSEGMELENSNAPPTALDSTGSDPNSAAIGDSNGKRGREGLAEGRVEDDEEASKKKKVEKSEEEEHLNKGGEGGEQSGPIRLGPKTFASSTEMFYYFSDFSHYWSPNLNINKYEQMVLLDLLKKGHPEPDRKIGGGIRAFHVQHHPVWKSLCFFLIRVDNSVDDFSFRKCVDRIRPLPEDLKYTNKAFDVAKTKGGRGGGRGRGGRGGRGGRPRH